MHTLIVCYHRDRIQQSGSLVKGRPLLFLVLEARKPQSKALVDSVSGEDLTSTSRMAPGCCDLHREGTLFWCGRRTEESVSASTAPEVAAS